MSKAHADEYELFGRHTAALREKHNISQTLMSEILQIPLSTYAGYETGKRKVPLNIIKKVAAYFEVSIEYLLTENDKEGKDDFTTVAAHYDEEEWTKEEQEYIDIVKNMLREKRKRKKAYDVR